MRYLTLFWIIVIAYHIWNIKKTYIRFNNSRKYLKYIIIISTINIITYLYMGVIFGFLKNPYSQKLTTMLERIKKY